MPPVPRPRPGRHPREVEVCYRQRQYARARYCQAHHLRWKAARRRGETADEEAWRRSESAVNADREVNLRGLPERVVAEILYGLQARTAAGSKTWDHFLHPLCDRLRADGAPSLEVFADPVKFETLAHTKSMPAWYGRCWSG
ncbi:hypothetical protein [Streptomyces lavendulocolor]|uniref:hypothetical protein n=1 Tax=Streptomyces lavendulocolor TaxID=67316 RepID=UPI003C2DAA95